MLIQVSETQFPIIKLVIRVLNKNDRREQSLHVFKHWIMPIYLSFPEDVIGK
jgi:hypothetical protein